MKVQFLPAADREFRETATYYDSRVLGLGQEFIAEVERMCAILSENTTLGPRLDTLHRRAVLRRFPFALIYRVDYEAVRIVAVAHKRRRPNYWHGRV